MTFDYWLGLNKIAQESGGAGAEICVPDTETGATPAANGWYPRSNGSGEDQHIDYVNDNERGRVLEITNDVGATTTAKYIIGDYAAGEGNPNDNPFDTDNAVLSMWVKGDGTNYFNIAVLAMTNQAARILYLNATDGSDAKYAPPSTSYEFRIGSSWRAAQWQYLEVDLAARVDGLEPGETIEHIDGIIPMVGRYLALDDIKFSEGRLSRSWAQVPGAALGGYLGAQTGAAGAVGVSAWDKYYYHFSDLGTVMATTNADGYTLGVYQPDFWGNYRETYGVRPDTMGLTGKFCDEDLHLNYFNARWYDPERGRFISRTPLPYNIEHQYAIAQSNPVIYVDAQGEKWYKPCSWFGSSCDVWDEFWDLNYNNLFKCPGAILNTGVGWDDKNGNPYKHCVWNCRMERNCPQFTSNAASYAKELVDVGGALVGHRGSANSAMQSSDFADNETGRQGANKDCSCEEHCRDMGINPDTPEGPGTARPYGPYSGRFWGGGFWGKP